MRIGVIESLLKVTKEVVKERTTEYLYVPKKLFILFLELFNSCGTAFDIFLTIFNLAFVFHFFC